MKKVWGFSAIPVTAVERPPRKGPTIRNSMASNKAGSKVTFASLDVSCAKLGVMTPHKVNNVKRRIEG
jgi:hypothetical protein